jgi:hypothetical protein
MDADLASCEKSTACAIALIRDGVVAATVLELARICEKVDEHSRSLAVGFSAMSTAASGRGCVKTLSPLALQK